MHRVTMVMKKIASPPRSGFFVFLLFAFILVFHESWALQSVESHPGFAAGQELISRGSYPEAIDIFREISQSSDNPDIRANALFHMGSIYESCLNLPEEAVESYRALILMYPESPTAQDALFNIGKIYYRNERYRESLKTFQDYMALYPSGMRMESVKSWAGNAARKCREEDETDHPPPPLTSLDPTVRVLLQKNTERLQVSGPSTLTVRSLEKGERIFEGQGPFLFSRKGKKLTLNGTPLGTDACRIMSQGEWIGLDGRKYRGFIAVHLKNGALMAVNHLNVESYLYGVVPKEMSPLWAPQALEAQAIASRTYALYIREKHATGDKTYDLECTTSSQVYGGYDVEKASARAAVDATKGVVMAHDGKLIISYFHANSGGRTESSLNVWGVDIPYLKSVEDNYSVDPADQPWEYFFTFKELERLFVRLLPGKSLKRIEPQDKSPSGRILHFMLFSDDKQVKVSGNSFRLKLGPVNVKSTICELIPEKNGIRFKGTGYGHGVGMSQVGAHRMALAGLSREDILKHYYSDVSIMRVSYL